MISRIAGEILEVGDTRKASGALQGVEFTLIGLADNSRDRLHAQRSMVHPLIYTPRKQALTRVRRVHGGATSETNLRHVNIM
jgi:hypothetical protein